MARFRRLYQQEPRKIVGTYLVLTVVVMFLQGCGGGTRVSLLSVVHALVAASRLRDRVQRVRRTIPSEGASEFFAESPFLEAV